MKQMAILQIEELTKHFGGVHALSDVSFDIEDHRISALIGPNGAGKTTLFNIVAGVFPPTAGVVRMAGSELNGDARAYPRAAWASAAPSRTHCSSTT